MHDHARYRVHLCAGTAALLIFVTLFAAHLTRRFRPFPIHSEPFPNRKPIRSGPSPSLALKPVCSFNLFKDIASSQSDGFVSGSGTWKRNIKGVPEYFQPKVCRFRHKLHIPRQDVVQCIRRHRLHYVVFAGDSNSMRYFVAFRALLADIGAHCLSVQVCIVIFLTDSRPSVIYS